MSIIYRFTRLINIHLTCIVNLYTGERTVVLFIVNFYTGERIVELFSVKMSSSHVEVQLAYSIKKVGYNLEKYSYI